MRLMFSKYLSEYQPWRIRSISSLKVSSVRRLPSKILIRLPQKIIGGFYEMHASSRKCIEGFVCLIGEVRAGHDDGRSAIFEQVDLPRQPFVYFPDVIQQIADRPRHT